MIDAKEWRTITSEKKKKLDDFIDRMTTLSAFSSNETKSFVDWRHTTQKGSYLSAKKGISSILKESTIANPPLLGGDNYEYKSPILRSEIGSEAEISRMGSINQ